MAIDVVATLRDLIAVPVLELVRGVWAVLQAGATAFSALGPFTILLGVGCTLAGLYLVYAYVHEMETDAGPPLFGGGRFD